MSSHPPLRSFIKCASKHHQQQCSGPKAAWLDDSRRVLIVVTISFRRMKTAVALTTKEEADEEKRRQRKTQNERKTRTIQIFYFLRDGCRDTTSITTIIRSIFRLERVEINLLGFFLLLFQVKLFVGHDSFYAMMMRVIFCRLFQKRGEL